MKSVQKSLLPNELLEADICNQLCQPLDQANVKQILPHRSPFLFIDGVDFINCHERIIRASRYIDPADPVFKGHFPKNPVFPGVLQIETLFQAGLALLYFIVYETLQPLPEYAAIDAVGTRVNDFSFKEAVKPGDTLSIIARITAFDGVMCDCQGEIYSNSRLCTVGKGEIYVL